MADKLPQFYSWVATQFPAGTIKLSKRLTLDMMPSMKTSGNKRNKLKLRRSVPGCGNYLGNCCELRSRSTSLSAITKERSRHELQLDTLNRAVDFCRYYRSAFAITQQTATDSDSISSILIKIWDMAATTPFGLAVRDAYRGVKALQRRAKELGLMSATRSICTTKRKMGKGVVQRQGVW